MRPILKNISVGMRNLRKISYVIFQTTTITSRLRSAQILPKVYTRTKRYCSFIQYGLNHYQYYLSYY